MKFGSVCSGIEAASVAWHPLGWRAAWFAEIEPFPCAVLAHHYPEVPNHGDMSVLPDLVALGEVEAPDILCGGTPCQAFSVAGLRRSLDDARGNLSLIFTQLANAIDDRRTADGQPPCIVFWENVPGVLNTKDNAFGCFLAGLAGEDDALQPPGGKWTDAGVVLGPTRAVAWRVLDAQYFGLAQRRKRVFVVASARDDFDPVAVLFELDGVRRDTAPSREAGEGTPTSVIKGAAIGRKPEAGPQFSEHLHDGSCYTLNCVDQHAVVTGGSGLDTFECGGIGSYSSSSVSSPVLRTGADKGHGCEALITFDPTQITSATNRSNPCHTPVKGMHAPAVAFSSKDYGADATPDLAPTLRAMNHTDSHANGGGQMAVAVAVDVYNHTVGGDLAATLNAESGAPNHSGPKLLQNMQVRRLTPRECERLQGFPDDYTLIPYRNKPAADGPRYKALGNSWAVPVVRWIGWRINTLTTLI